MLRVTVRSSAELWLGGGAGHTGGPLGPSSTSPPSVCKLLGSIRYPSLPGSLRPSEEARPERPALWACSDPGPTCSGVCGCAGLGCKTQELWGTLLRPLPRLRWGRDPAGSWGCRASMRHQGQNHPQHMPFPVLGPSIEAQRPPASWGPSQRGRQCLWGARCLSWGATQPKAGHSLTLPGNLGGNEHPPSLPFSPSLHPSLPCRPRSSLWTQSVLEREMHVGPGYRLCLC